MSSQEIENIVGLIKALEDSQNITKESKFWPDVERYNNAIRKEKEIIEKYNLILGKELPEKAFEMVFGIKPLFGISYNSDKSFIYFTLNIIDMHRITKSDLSYDGVIFDKYIKIPELSSRVGAIVDHISLESTKKVIMHERWHSILSEYFGWSGHELAGETLMKYYGTEYNHEKLKLVEGAYSEKIKEEILCNAISNHSSSDNLTLISGYWDEFQSYVFRGLFTGQIDSKFITDVERMTKYSEKVVESIHFYKNMLNETQLAVSVIKSPFIHIENNLPEIYERL